MDSSHASEDLVRMRAYALWEEAGCPTGDPDVFWHRARAELSTDDKSYDVAVEDSFPASDPPSHSGTTGPTNSV